MSKSEDTSDNIGKITIQLDDLYKSDPTLDHIKRLEEDRKALMSVTDLSASWSEPTIQDRLEDMRVALGYPKLEDAFKSHEDYMAVTSPLISALEKDNAQSLLEAFKLDTEPYLDSSYAQTLKATSLFSDTLQNVSALGSVKVPDYLEDMKKTMSLYDTSLGLGNKSLVELATKFESSAFKNKFGLAGNISAVSNITNPTIHALNSLGLESAAMSTISEALKPSTSALDSIGFQAAKTLKAFQPVKSPWLDKLNDSQKAFKMVSDINIPKIELPEIPHFEPPRPEDSPHYKQNEKILKNSEEQIALLNEVSVYMSAQSEKLEFLNQITSQQVEDNKEIAEKQMEENKIAAEKEMAVNSKSSRNAMYVAMAGILLTLVVSVISIWATLYVYGLQDISDNKDHSEVMKVLKENNLNGSISELVKQLKIQNQNTNELNKVKKENEKMKALLETKKSK